MDKTYKMFLPISGEPMSPSRAFYNARFNPDTEMQDKRVGQLLVLLQQLEDATHGLGTLPKAELTEIISSAIGLCGFADPTETQDMMAIVLDAIEMSGPVQKSP